MLWRGSLLGLGPIHEFSRLPADTCTVAMRRPHAAATLAAVLLLWLAVLTVAFHGCARLGYGGLSMTRRTSLVAVPRKMLLAVTSFDAAASPTDHHHRHQHHRHHHHQHDQHHHHHHAGRWNRQGIPPSVATNGEGIDPRYGVQKRLVPTGPNPLHH
ncbi:protein FON2 SPARE1-like [Phragmites australis]|uniref:protein FON2 SPARE1-like n=1 Tax=Phragmites australis TaxID=29695 RepID=UPI002D77C190|nr:protein FON2 SPARE1-like [Phragmites australis]